MFQIYPFSGSQTVWTSSCGKQK